MSVTVVVPTHHRPDLLKVALNSCVKQTVFPHEVIIGDDSQDNLTEVMLENDYKDVPFKLTYHRHKPSLKQAGNVNFLFNQVKTEYLMLLHDDDWLMPHALELLLDAFIENPTIIASFGKQHLTDNEGNYNVESSLKFNLLCNRTKAYSGLIKTARHASLRKQFPSNGYLINTDVARKTGYADMNAGNAVDFSFSFRLGDCGKPVFFVDEYVAAYRKNEMALSSNNSNSGYNAYKQVWNFIAEDDILMQLRDDFLLTMSMGGIASGAQNGYTLYPVMWYFSRYHRKRILSLGGIRRLFLIIFSLFKFKKSV